MSDEQDKLKLSLEPPKLFGRKKKSDATGTSKSTSPAPAEQPSPAADAPAVDPTDVVDDEPTEVIEEPTPAEPAAEEPAAEEPTEPAPAKKAAPAKQASPVKEAASATKPAPAKKPAKKPVAAAAAPTEGSVPAKKTERPRAKLAPEIEPEPITATHHDHDLDLSELDEDEGPLLPVYPAAAVSGALVGLTMVVLTWLSLRGCESIRGTASCGGGPGLVLLIATFVVCILLGSTLLKVFQIPDPGSSSFLGVGLVAVVSLLFLIDVLDHWSMLIVIPVISVGAFLASVWVTKTFVEPGEA